MESWLGQRCRGWVRGWILGLGWGGGGEAGQELNPSFTSIPGTPFSGAGPALAEALFGTKKLHYPFSPSLRLGLEMGKHQEFWATEAPSLRVGPENAEWLRPTEPSWRSELCPVGKVGLGSQSF